MLHRKNKCDDCIPQNKSFLGLFDKWSIIVLHVTLYNQMCFWYDLINYSLLVLKNKQHIFSQVYLFT